MNRTTPVTSAVESRSTAYAPLIKEIGRGAKGSHPLTREQAEWLFGRILDGGVPPLELGAILLSLRMKGESLDELLGFKAALDARTVQIVFPPGAPRVVVLPTYNGARRQPNLMPLLALLLARHGVPVLIQGRHDFDSRVSPFDLLEDLGIEPAADIAVAAQQLAGNRLACLRLETLCPGLADLLALRPRLGLRNSGHTVAKLLDPCRGRSLRLVAVTHPEYLLRMNELLQAEHASAMLLRGTEGEAYANPRRRPRLLGYRDGEPLLLAEAEEGGAPPLASLPDLPDASANAGLIRDMLDGHLPIPGPIIDQAIALLWLSGACTSAEEARQRISQ
ncbi:MAG: DNA-binding protein YbiB [Candidatus Methylophosphatis roskildensis]